MKKQSIRFFTNLAAVLTSASVFVACGDDAKPDGSVEHPDAFAGSGGSAAGETAVRADGGAAAGGDASSAGSAMVVAEAGDAGNGSGGGAAAAGGMGLAGEAQGGSVGENGGFPGENGGESSGWTELDPLPTVASAYSFALAANAEGEPRLGFMFQDEPYRQQLLDQGDVLWDGGGVYSGKQVLAIYEPSAGTTEWQPYQGRLTPQTYRYSELTFNGADSYYTTTFPSFGGLVSVVKNGAAGAYALTPAFTDRRAHSVGFLNGQLYALIAQKTAGLTLSTYPADQVGTTLANLWQNLVTLAPDASSVLDPTLLSAADQLVAGYVLDGQAVVRRSKQPAGLASVADFTVIGGCNDALHLALASRASTLYRACISVDGALDLSSADLAADQVTWQPLPSGVVGSVAATDISATADGVALAVRQGDALRVFDAARNAAPSFDAVVPGSFQLLDSTAGLLLAVCDLTDGAPHTLRTFRR